MRKHVWNNNRQYIQLTEYVKKNENLLSTVLDYKSKPNNYALLSKLIFCTGQICGMLYKTC